MNDWSALVIELIKFCLLNSIYRRTPLIKWTAISMSCFKNQAFVLATKSRKMCLMILEVWKLVLICTYDLLKGKGVGWQHIWFQIFKRNVVVWCCILDTDCPCTFELYPFVFFSGHLQSLSFLHPRYVCLNPASVETRQYLLSRNIALMWQRFGNKVEVAERIMVQYIFYCIVILLSSLLNLLKEYVTCCFSSDGLHLIAVVV